MKICYVDIVHIFQWIYDSGNILLLNKKILLEQLDNLKQKIK